MNSILFSQIKLAELELRNRIIVAPMCQYSANKGSATDWHLMHLGQFAVSGVGLLFTEATAVEKEGRISPGCLGLWSDENEQALKRVVDFCKNFGNTHLGIQLAHAGRKASTDLPWFGSKSIPPEDARGWKTSAPSAMAYADNWGIPKALDEKGLERVKNSFVQATNRSLKIGFDVVEVHMAHGYLFHQFLSPLSNKRNDSYGGNLEGRMKFPLETFHEIRKVWPKSKPLGVRISATDWVKNSSWDINEATEFSFRLKELGCDFIDISSGGNSPLQQITVGPGYQTKFASEIKKQTSIPTMAVGQITEPKQAETILQSNQADMISIARGMLFNPRWAWHAADELNQETAYAPQYMRTKKTLRGLPIPGNPPVAKNN